jgi:hypothetical protein
MENNQNFGILTLGQLTDKMFELRQNKAAYENIVKDIVKQIDEVEYYIIQRMEEINIDKMATDKGTISKKVELYPKITDKQAFFEWLKANDKPEMAVLNVNKASFTEYFESMAEYPGGVDAFMKSKLNIRSKN